MKIGIICGHGAGDPGANSTTYGTEANFVRNLAPYIKKYLERYAEVVIFNTSRNHYKYLQTNSINFKSYDYIIELHGNAGVSDQGGNGKTTGIEIWVTSSEKGISVEQTICKRISEKFGLKNRGVKVCDFFVIRTIKKQGVSCCLIENGFMDDKDDMKIIHDNMDSYCKILADAVAEGFGLKANSAPSTSKPTTNDTTSSKVLYRVQCGAYKERSNADALETKLNNAGYKTFITFVDNLYKVQVGAYSVKANAEALLTKLKAAGFNVFIVTGETSGNVVTSTLKVGSKVKVNKNAKSYEGKTISSFVYSDTWIVYSISGNRVVINKNASGTNSIMTAFKKTDLTIV